MAQTDAITCLCEKIYHVEQLPTTKNNIARVGRDDHVSTTRKIAITKRGLFLLNREHCASEGFCRNGIDIIMFRPTL